MKLPRPVTTTDFYLAAILDELRRGRPETAASPPGTVELREPAAVSAAKTPIPKGFPGRSALLKAGIDSLEAIPYDGDTLVGIPGISKATAGKILTRLS